MRSILVATTCSSCGGGTCSRARGGAGSGSGGGFVNTFFIQPLAVTIAPGSPVALRAATATSGRTVTAARYC